MGRLEEIVERNKHPRKHRQGRFPLGILMSAFVLLILVLMIFTDLGGGAKKPGEGSGSSAEAPVAPPEKGRVRDVGIVVDHKRAARDAGPSD